MKRPNRKPPEQTPFIILIGQGRRYRNVTLAYDADEARDKAHQMAATLIGNFAVQPVRRAGARASTGNAQAGLLRRNRAALAGRPRLSHARASTG